MTDKPSKVDKNRGQFQKGKQKTGGRQKGTPNKRTAEIVERLEKEDIVGSLLNIAKTTQDENIKVTVYKELMKYAYPQRKAVDISGDMNINDEPFEVKII